MKLGPNYIVLKDRRIECAPIFCCCKDVCLIMANDMITMHKIESWFFIHVIEN